MTITFRATAINTAALQAEYDKIRSAMVDAVLVMAQASSAMPIAKARRRYREDAPDAFGWST